LQLTVYLAYKVFLEEVGAQTAPMAVNHCKQRGFQHAVKPQILGDDIVVFHVGAIAYVRNNADVESLNYEIRPGQLYGHSRLQDYDILLVKPVQNTRDTFLKWPVGKSPYLHTEH